MKKKKRLGPAEIIMSIKGPSGRRLNVLDKDIDTTRTIKEFMKREESWLKLQEQTQ